MYLHVLKISNTNTDTFSLLCIMSNLHVPLIKNDFLGLGDNDHGRTSYTTLEKRLCNSLSCKHDTNTSKRPKTAVKYAIN